MTDFNTWWNDTQAQLTKYFSGCTQNEWIAWGLNGLGFLLFVVGITLFFF